MTIKSREIKTAALPTSLAFLESGCLALLIRSTVISIPVFKSSTIKTSKTELTSR